MAASAKTPAWRAGGKASLVARTNAETNTFWRICGWRCDAILPRHTVVFVLKFIKKVCNTKLIKSETQKRLFRIIAKAKLIKMDFYLFSISIYCGYLVMLQINKNN